MTAGATVDHTAVGGSTQGDGGVAHGSLLTRFVEAVHTGDDLDASRDQLVTTLGWEAAVDVAAVCANFHTMTRIADGTGTPLDEGSVAMSEDLRADLGLDGLDSARF